MFNHKNTSAPETDYLTLNSTVATADHTLIANDTMPTSSVFSVGTDASTNKSSSPMIAYLFTGIQGFSKFGSYTANGNADGPFIYTGFQPSFIIIKNSSRSGEHWNIHDTTRQTYNLNDRYLLTNSSGAENTSASYAIDILSNGFKARTNNESTNYSSDSYIYIAFAEAPFVNSNGVPCNAR